MQGIDGFLGTRASFMLDVVALAMVAVLPVLGWSIYLVKYRQQYALHKRMQLTLGSGAAGHGAAVRDSTCASTAGAIGRRRLLTRQDGGIDWVLVALGVHLCFAVTTALLWAAVIIRALRHFPQPPAPSPHSAWHRRFGRLAAIDMVCTAVTGWIFYWLAFVA